MSNITANNFGLPAPLNDVGYANVVQISAEQYAHVTDRLTEIEGWMPLVNPNQDDIDAFLSMGARDTNDQLEPVTREEYDYYEGL